MALEREMIMYWYLTLSFRLPEDQDLVDWLRQVPSGQRSVYVKKILRQWLENKKAEEKQPT